MKTTYSKKSASSDKQNEKLETDDYSIYTDERTEKVHHIYLNDHITGSTTKYTKICNFFRTVSEEDKILMYLSSYGGSCHAGMQIINAMQDSLAAITVILDAPCYSMASLIALASDDLFFNPGTFLLFHNYTTIDVGKRKEFLDSIHAHDDWLQQQMRMCASPFLTKKELAYIENDQDFYINWLGETNVTFHKDLTLAKRLARHFGKSANRDSTIKLIAESKLTKRSKA